LKSGGVDIIGEVGFFMRGDTDFNQERDVTDPIVTLVFLFIGGSKMPCDDAADANDDGKVDISDAIETLSKLYLSQEPFPDPNQWGPDPTQDDLGCAVYLN
jgi:hypothetical protein